MATAPLPSTNAKVYRSEWKTITPIAIQPAVEFLRKRFEQQAKAIAFVMKRWCFCALHPDLPVASEPPIKPQSFQHYFDSLIPSRGTPEPVVFQRYFDACAALLAQDGRKIFQRLQIIAVAQAHTLGHEPVDWAAAQTRMMIEENSYLIKLWLKSSCDKQEANNLDDPDGLDEAIYWNNWRAPKWLYMKPIANNPYDRVSAWEREDEARTQNVLKFVPERFNLRLTMELEKEVGETRVRLAGENGQSARPARSQSKKLSESPGTQKGKLNYRSDLKRGIQLRLIQEPDVKNRSLCDWLDEEGAVDLPKPWRKGGNRSWRIAYEDPKIQARIDVTISKVRGDMRDHGILVAGNRR